MPPTPRSSPSLGLGRPLLFCLLILIALLYLVRAPSAAPTPTPIALKKPLAAAVPDQQEQDRIYTQRIIGLADIHGDLPAMTSILRMMKLVDMRGNWIGGNAVLVQTGDLVDRGPALIAITKFWDTLRPQAEKAGGGVVNLLGNHEIMNALGDWRYVTKEDIASFGGERQRRAALSTGFIGQTWRTNYSITARVPFTHSFTSLPSSLAHTMPKTPRGSSSQIFLGDPLPPSGASKDPFSHAAASFVHGGITPEYLHSLSSSQPINKINSLGSSILYSLLDSPAPLSLPRGATEEEREFWSERGPMWNREYALDDDEASVCERAEKACEILGVRHLLMGHTPHFEGIVSRCGGKILLIDTGISRAYGGAHSALEMLYTLTPVEDDEEGGSAIASGETTRWIEKEVVSAMYTGGRETEVLATSEREVEIPVA